VSQKKSLKIDYQSIMALDPIRERQRLNLLGAW